MTQNRRIIVADELERIWKVEVVAYFKILPSHFPGENREDHRNKRLQSG